MENQSIVKRMLNFSWFVTINNGEDFGFVEARQNTRYTIVLYVAKRLFISKQIGEKVQSQTNIQSAELQSWVKKRGK